MSEMLKIGGICGSLRKDSLNKKLLLASQHLCPSTATIEILDISNLPLFNQDHENNVIKEVVEFKEKVRKMDGILFVSPEYNYSISSPLKNAIDWASRPYGDSAWNRKPVAIQGTTIGTHGTVRAQSHLRQTFVFLDMIPLLTPEVCVPTGPDKFDETGKLIDDFTKVKIEEQLQTFIHLINLYKNAPEGYYV